LKRSEIIDSISSMSGVNREDTKKVFESTFEFIMQQLVKEQDVLITGFGSFRYGKRNARKGIKPKTGEVVNIAPRNVVTFKPSVPLKEMINGKRDC